MFATPLGLCKKRFNQDIDSISINPTNTHSLEGELCKDERGFLEVFCTFLTSDGMSGGESWAPYSDVWGGQAGNLS